MLDCHGKRSNEQEEFFTNKLDLN